MTEFESTAAARDDGFSLSDGVANPSRLPIEVTELLAAQDQAATNLLASQVAVAERLRLKPGEGTTLTLRLPTKGNQ